MFFHRRLVLFPALILFLVSCGTSPANRQMAAEYLKIAEAYRELGREKEASAYYLKAYGLDPSLHVAGYNLVIVNLEQKEYKKATNLCRQLLSSDEDNMLVREAYAYALFHDGNAEEALENYEILRKKIRGDYALLYNTALVYRHLGKYDESTEILLEIREYWPEKEGTTMRLAETYAQAGDYDEALQQLLVLEEMQEISVEGRLLLAQIYFDREIFVQSLQQYEKVLKEAELTNEQKAEAAFRHAFIMLRVIENNAEGMVSLKTALDAGFQDEEMMTELVFENYDQPPGEETRNDIIELLESRGWEMEADAMKAPTQDS